MRCFAEPVNRCKILIAQHLYKRLEEVADFVKRLPLRFSQRTPFSVRKDSIIMKNLVGWREWIALPDIGIVAMQCKVDTGAKTSALHAFKIECFDVNQEHWVRFSVHTDETDLNKVQVCEAKVVDQRSVTDSSGNTRQRFFIETRLEIGKSSYPIQVSLTCRDSLKFNMLLGRSALRKGHFIVDPSKSYQQGKNK